MSTPNETVIRRVRVVPWFGSALGGHEMDAWLETGIPYKIGYVGWDYVYLEAENVPKMVDIGNEEFGELAWVTFDGETIDWKDSDPNAQHTSSIEIDTIEGKKKVWRVEIGWVDTMRHQTKRFWVDGNTVFVQNMEWRKDDPEDLYAHFRQVSLTMHEFDGEPMQPFIDSLEAQGYIDITRYMPL